MYGKLGHYHTISPIKIYVRILDRQALQQNGICR